MTTTYEKIEAFKATTEAFASIEAMMVIEMTAMVIAGAFPEVYEPTAGDPARVAYAEWRAPLLAGGQIYMIRAETPVDPTTGAEGATTYAYAKAYGVTDPEWIPFDPETAEAALVAA